MLSDNKNVKRVGIETFCLKFESPHICSLKNYFKSKNNYYIIMDYCKHSLLNIQTDYPNYFLGHVDRTRDFAFQVLMGYIKLYENKIIHRDLKPANLLLDEFGEEGFNIKIADFGLAFNLTDNLEMSIAGTPLYSPPEYQRKKSLQNPSHKIDLYALGIIIYELFFGYYPFGKPKTLIDLQNIFEKDNLKINFRECKDNELINLIKGCINFDEDKRFTLYDCVTHAFIKKHPKYNDQSYIEDIKNLNKIFQHETMHTFVNSNHQSYNQTREKEMPLEKDQEIEKEKDKYVDFSLLQIGKKTPKLIEPKEPKELKEKKELKELKEKYEPKENKDFKSKPNRKNSNKIIDENPINQTIKSESNSTLFITAKNSDNAIIDQENNDQIEQNENVSESQPNENVQSSVTSKKKKNPKRNKNKSRNTVPTTEENQLVSNENYSDVNSVLNQNDPKPKEELSKLENKVENLEDPLIQNNSNTEENILDIDSKVDAKINIDPTLTVQNQTEADNVENQKNSTSSNLKLVVEEISISGIEKGSLGLESQKDVQLEYTEVKPKPSSQTVNTHLNQSTISVKNTIDNEELAKKQMVKIEETLNILEALYNLGVVEMSKCIYNRCFVIMRVIMDLASKVRQINSVFFNFSDSNRVKTRYFKFVNEVYNLYKVIKNYFEKENFDVEIKIKEVSEYYRQTNLIAKQYINDFVCYIDKMKSVHHKEVTQSKSDLNLLDKKFNEEISPFKSQVFYLLQYLRNRAEDQGYEYDVERLDRVSSDYA